MLVSDNELLGRYVHAGDQDALECLIRQHSKMVMGVCRNLLWQMEDAEDAFQATFLLLSAKAPKLLTHNSVGGWLHEAAVRICLKLRRDICRIREVEMAEEPVAKLNEPWQNITSSHDHELLHRELKRLPRRNREAMILVHLEGKSRSQAASILDCTTATIKGALARGRKQLRQRLIRHGVVASSLLGALAISKTAEAGISETLIAATLHHCQGLTPDIVVGSGPDIVQSLVQKELSMSIFGFSKIGAAAAFVTALGTLTLVALAGNSMLPVEAKVVELTINDVVLEPPGVGFSQDQDETVEKPSAGVGGGIGAGASASGVGAALASPGSGIDDAKATDDVQYYAPGPEFKLAREAAALKEQKAERISQKLQSETRNMISSTSKKSNETWQAYLKRLNKANYVSNAQLATWRAGNPITIEREITIIDVRMEKQTREIPVTRRYNGKNWETVRIPIAENADGTKSDQRVNVDVPFERTAEGDPVAGATYAEMITQTYTVSVPYQRKVIATLVLPAPGSVQDSETNIGFSFALDRKKMLGMARDKNLPPVPERIQGPQKTDPTQQDVQFDELRDLVFAVYNMRNSIETTGHPGYEIVGHPDGTLYRQMLDINRDGQLDQWVFFKGGKETYREVDLDFDKKVDQYQYTNGAKIRYGIDEDQDGKIDRWIDK